MATPNQTSPETWKKIQELCEEGMDDNWLESHFNIPKNRIRQKRHADEKRGKPWKTPKLAAKQAHLKMVESFFKSRQNGDTGGPNAELAIVSPAVLAQLREGIPGIVAKEMADRLLAAVQHLPPPKDAQEFKVYYDIFRKSLGLDQQAGVTVNFNGMQWGSQKPPKDMGPIVVVDAKRVTNGANS